MYPNEAPEIDVKFVTGVCKAYYKSARSHPRAAKKWHVYGYDVTGKFVRRKVPAFMVPIYRLKKVKVKKFPCGHVVVTREKNCPACMSVSNTD